MFHVAILVKCGMVLRGGMFPPLMGVLSTGEGGVLVVSCDGDGGGGRGGGERSEVGR